MCSIAYIVSSWVSVNLSDHVQDQPYGFHLTSVYPQFTDILKPNLVSRFGENLAGIGTLSSISKYYPSSLSIRCSLEVPIRLARWLFRSYRYLRRTWRLQLSAIYWVFSRFRARSLYEVVLCGPYKAVPSPCYIASIHLSPLSSLVLQYAVVVSSRIQSPSTPWCNTLLFGSRAISLLQA